MEQQYREFFSWIFEKDEKIYSEMDLATEGKIYYPEDIKSIIDTKEMQRLKKVLQLSSIIVDEETAYNTRYEHSLGTYAKGVELYINLYKNKQWKDIHNNKEEKLNIIASLIELLTHDIGHLTFSHTLESLIGKRGAHEVIGNRIIDESLQNKIFSINPKLPEILKERRNHEYATIKEGNVDLDRMDYLIHDMIYLESEDMEVKEISEDILKHTTLEKIEINGKYEEVPIYENEAVEKINKLLEIRNKNYKRIYNSNREFALSKMYNKLCSAILNSDEKLPFKDFLEECNKNKLNTDLEKHSESNDIKTLNAFLDILEKSKNENLCQMAIICIPSLKGLINIVYKMIDFPDSVDKENSNIQKLIPDSEERKLYEKIKKYVKGTNLTTREKKIQTKLMLKDKKEIFFHVYDFGKDIDSIRKKMKKIGIDDSVIEEITLKSKINKYKKSDINLARNQDGKIVKLIEHPDFKVDMSDEYICGGYICDITLKEQGISNEQISKLKNICANYEVIKTNKSKRPSIIANSEDAVKKKYNAVQER